MADDEAPRFQIVEGELAEGEPRLILQERERPVPCRRCRRKTWNVNAFCSQECEDKDRWLDEMGQ